MRVSSFAIPSTERMSSLHLTGCIFRFRNDFRSRVVKALPLLSGNLILPGALLWGTVSKPTPECLNQTYITRQNSLHNEREIIKFERNIFVQLSKCRVHCVSLLKRDMLMNLLFNHRSNLPASKKRKRKKWMQRYSESTIYRQYLKVKSRPWKEIRMGASPTSFYKVLKHDSVYHCQEVS